MPPEKPRFVAFLRGMNLGRRRITNPELCAAFEAIGFENVAAFMASGNVIFDAADTDPTALEQRIEDGLQSTLEYAVPTFVRTAEQVRAIATRPVFADVANAGTGQPQVAMMRRPIPAADQTAVTALATPEDRLEIHATELYWLPRNGISKSELDLNAVERLTGTLTIRTKRTVERIAARI